MIEPAPHNYAGRGPVLASLLSPFFLYCRAIPHANPIPINPSWLSFPQHNPTPTTLFLFFYILLFSPPPILLFPLPPISLSFFFIIPILS